MTNVVNTWKKEIKILNIYGLGLMVVEECEWVVNI